MPGLCYNPNMWFWLAAASAVLGAVDVTLNKKILHNVSAAVLTWSLFALTLPIVAIIVLKEGIPSLSLLFFVGVFGSAFSFVFAKTVMNETLKQNLVSKVYPLTAFSGFFTYIFGLLLLSETIRPIPILGLTTVIVGSYFLNLDQAKESFFKPFKILFSSKASLLYLFAIMLNSITSVFDKMGITNSQPNSPVFVMLVEQLTMSLLLFLFLQSRERETWISQLKGSFGILFLNSIIFLITSFLVFYSFIGGPVALVMGIKRLQIFFILILSYLFFKDKPAKHVWAATLIMILGVILIKIG